MTKRYGIIWLDSIDSTNDEAKRHISDIDNLSVLSALEQTSGRGQRGNKWSSAAGENLMFSIILKFSSEDSGASGSLPHLSARKQFVLNEIVSLSVVDFLSRHGISADIKWPNDIYVNDKKICGILIENSLRSTWLSTSIIGIGLNINQRNFNVNIPNPTSMVLCIQDNKAYFDIRHCLEEFMDIFSSYLTKHLSVGNGLSNLRQQYLSRLWRLGRPARFIDYTTQPSGHLDGPMNIGDVSLSIDQNGTAKDICRQFPGIIHGLSEIGNLRVEDLSTGQLREFGFKEIGYIL